MISLKSSIDSTKRRLKYLEKRVMVACSGGPDSIFLLYLLKDKDPLVFHVNHNKRADSDKDQRLVESFCKEHGLKLVVRSLRPSQERIANFHAWARQKRYDLALELARREGIKTLLVAHHKDDFLETALMQRGRGNFLVGIPKQTLWKQQLLVERPLLFSFWKQQIEDILTSKGIAFIVDSSNFDSSYTRARLRLRLGSWNKIKKTLFFYYLLLIYRLREIKLMRSKRLFDSWEKGGFNLRELKGLRRKEQERQLYLFFASRVENIVKFSSRKVRSILDFLNANNGDRMFKLSNLLSLKKERGRLVILRNELER